MWFLSVQTTKKVIQFQSEWVKNQISAASLAGLLSHKLAGENYLEFPQTPHHDADKELLSLAPCPLPTSNILTFFQPVISSPQQMPSELCPAWPLTRI